MTFPKYEQDAWMERQGHNDSPWPELIDFWRLYNLHLAQVIQRIPEEAWNTECRIEPYEPMTLKFLVEDYVAHLEHHLGKIGEMTAG